MAGVPKSQGCAHTYNPCIRVIVEKDGKSAPVLLSANEDFNRLTRLRDAALRLPLGTLQKVRRLHDHKGDLATVWNTLPTGEDVAAIQRAWEAQGEHQTSHYFDERPLLDSDANYFPRNAATVISGTPANSEKSAPASNVTALPF